MQSNRRAGQENRSGIPSSKRLSEFRCDGRRRLWRRWRGFGRLTPAPSDRKCPLRWTHEGNGASITYHWPTRPERPHFGWQVEEGNPAECVLTWFSLPPETAHVDCTVDGKTIAETVRPVSRVVVSLPVDVEHRFVDALAYDAAGAPILRCRR